MPSLALSAISCQVFDLGEDVPSADAAAGSATSRCRLADNATPPSATALMPSGLSGAMACGPMERRQAVAGHRGQRLLRMPVCIAPPACLHSPAHPSAAENSNASTTRLEKTEISVKSPPASGGGLPRMSYLPNGLPISPRYHRLLNYFTNDILPSLSCHPSVHLDLCRGLIPATLHSPQLLSACLALSAAGFLSRGREEVDGVAVSRILDHLQSSGLSLLRTALQSEQMNETILPTCLIWCLTDVFTYQQGSSSWRIHLRGIKAILDSNRAHRYFTTDSGAARSAMRHLYLLYLSLQTLPYDPAVTQSETAATPMDSGLGQATDSAVEAKLVLGPEIDGFLGYSEELLHIIQSINKLARTPSEGSTAREYEADVLLGKLNAMIDRDSQAAPSVAIYTSLSPESSLEFELCHRTFQQATRIYLHRRLYRTPSNAPVMTASVEAIGRMVRNMGKAEPCHTWVAMAMPLFTIGCEAFSADQQAFVLDKIHKLDMCIGSYHVSMIRQALEDMWGRRKEAGDLDGHMCAEDLLGKLIRSPLLPMLT